MYNRNYNKNRNMDKYVIYILAGFSGVIIQGLVGFVKNKTIFIENL